MLSKGGNTLGADDIPKRILCLDQMDYAVTECGLSAVQAYSIVQTKQPTATVPNDNSKTDSKGIESID
jgi:hypothetical protein